MSFLYDRHIGMASDEKEKKVARNCNCKRSNCLKLYCECFANGAYCQLGKCNCISCMNNNNNSRKEAIIATLERNPHAFRSKIFMPEKSNVGGDISTKHHKGCHCKKSNCLKKYCECFQGGVVCSDRCRCIDCRNFQNSSYRMEAIQKMHARARQADLDAASVSDTGFNSEDKNDVLSSRSIYPRNSSDLDQSLVLCGPRSGWIGSTRTAGQLALISDDMINEVHKALTSQVRQSSLLAKRDMQHGNTCINTSYDSTATKRLKVDIAETFSESIREFVTKSLASTLSTSPHDDAISSTRCHTQYVESPPLSSTGMLYEAATSSGASYKANSMTRSHTYFSSSIPPGRVSDRDEEKLKANTDHSSTAVGNQSSSSRVSTCPPTLDTLSAPGTPSVAQQIGSSPNPHGFPALLGANALTLEPTTVSMQQIDAKSRWFQQQEQFPQEDGNKEGI